MDPKKEILKNALDEHGVNYEIEEDEDHSPYIADKQNSFVAIYKAMDEYARIKWNQGCKKQHGICSNYLLGDDPYTKWSNLIIAGAPLAEYAD